MTKPFASSFVPLVYSDSRNAETIGYSTTRASTSSVGESRIAARRAVPSLNRGGRFPTFGSRLVLTGAVSTTSASFMFPGSPGTDRSGPARSGIATHRPRALRSLSDERAQLGLQVGEG